MKKAPQHLSAEMKAFWRDVHRRFEMEPEHDQVLRLACEQFDRAQAAREQIAREGMTTADDERHPLIGVEAKATEIFLRAIRDLGIGDEQVSRSTPTEAGRKAAMTRWHKETA